MWATKIVQMGFCWKVGNGRRIRFWEDQWFGVSSLAIQFWPLYLINNEQGISMDRAWDGVNLKLTFSRSVPMNLMIMWEELFQIASSISFTEDNDDIIWKYESKGNYSVHSQYAVVNFRGIVPVHISVVRKLDMPPKFISFCGSYPITSY